jgi:eukaryotic-like serine/threonine-protein kinase
LPNGDLIDEVFDSFIVDENTFSSEKYQTQPQASANLIEKVDDLKTDYSKLNNLLSDKKWTAANRETMRLICKIISQKFPSIIEVRKISDFPCSSLRTIDQLWMRYS